MLDMYESLFHIAIYNGDNSSLSSNGSPHAFCVNSGADM